MKLWIFDRAKAQRAGKAYVYDDWAEMWGVKLNKPFIECQDAPLWYDGLALHWPPNNTANRPTSDTFCADRDSFSPWVDTTQSLDDFL